MSLVFSTFLITCICSGYLEVYHSADVIILTYWCIFCWFYLFSLCNLTNPFFSPKENLQTLGTEIERLIKHKHELEQKIKQT